MITTNSCYVNEGRKLLQYTVIESVDKASMKNNKGFIMKDAKLISYN